MIFCGKDEDTMQKDFLKAGIIGPNTKMHVDPRLKDP